MRNVLITTAALVLAAGTAFAEDTIVAQNGLAMTGEVSLDFAETANDNIGGTMNLDLGIDAGSLATVDLDLSATDGGSVTLDNWTIGTEVNGFALAFGDDNNLMPETDAITGTTGTLAIPAMTESLMVGTGDISIAFGLTDWNSDITDLSNVQGAYTVGVDAADITISGDYNLDSENTVLGLAANGIDLGMIEAGSALTYDMDAEVFAYEGSLGTNGLTAYLNGTDSNRLQNIGGEYTYNFAGAELTGGLNYNVDTEDMTPMASVGFAF
tara:strand:+ start:257 stop:1063 length:807 start_codon:yes stop_codon:yes gene_type:complete